MAKYINKLQGKKVLIVGGTSGIGFCAAEAALESGAQVFVASSSADRVASTLARLKNGSESTASAVFGKVIDVKSTAELQNFMAWIDNEGEGKGLDHLIYTAGDKLSLQPFLEANIDDVKAAADLRFWDTLRVIQAAYPLLKDKGRLASITLTSGTAMLKPPKGFAIASGIAGATESVTRGLAGDLSPVRVNCVLPGLVETELLDSIPAAFKDALLGNTKAFLTGKVGQPEDVAEAYLFCMKSAYLTGTTIKVDGGATLV